MDAVTLHHGDALDVLRGMADNSVDAVVTDPPSGIGFMGKTWDHDHGGREGWVKAFAAIFAECLRVVKPGGHALVWALPRTSHWTACALEDAGWEIRDCVAHLFGSGFPKSLDVGKAIDKAAGAEREVMGEYEVTRDISGGSWSDLHGKPNHARTLPLTAPATDAARQWDGWGTALKPAIEFWWLARKPLVGTVAANVQQWGTGGLNIEACRVGTAESTQMTVGRTAAEGWGLNKQAGQTRGGSPAGRWPPNVVLSHANYPVVRLAGNLPYGIIDTIRRYYDGYSRVSAMRARGGNYAVSAQVGAEVLQPGMQAGIDTDKADAQANRDDVRDVRQVVHCAGSMATPGTAEVLQQGMCGPSSRDVDGREGSALGQEALAGIPRQDVGKQDVLASSEEGARAYPVEGRALRSRRLRQRSYRDVAGSRAGDGAEDAPSRGLHSGTPPSDGDEVGATAGTARDGASPEWRQGGQPPRELDGHGVGQSQSEASRDREGDGGVTGNEPPLDVLAVDVPPQWQRYFYLTGERFGCQRVGTRRVREDKGGTRKAGTEFGQGSGWNSHENRDSVKAGHADADGLETVDDWRCVDGCPVKALAEQSGERKAAGHYNGEVTAARHGFIGGNTDAGWGYGDTGTAARFFPNFEPSPLDTLDAPFLYTAKASRREREAGLEGMAEKQQGQRYGTVQDARPHTRDDYEYPRQPMRNSHPTVKPLNLCRWLCRLICQPGGIVLDPFTGSGTTGMAATMEGFNFVGIEQDAEYIEIARRRIAWAQEQQPPLLRATGD